MTTGFYDSWAGMQQEKFEKIRRKVQPELLLRMFRDKLVLDVGCGNGYFQKVFSGNYIGVDIDEGMLRKPVALFPIVLGDGNELPFMDYSFDTVISMDTMHLVSSGDFRRVLKPGGVVMLSIFFNDENYEDRRTLLLEKIRSFEILEDFTIDGREKEYVVVALKPDFTSR